MDNPREIHHGDKGNGKGTSTNGKNRIDSSSSQLTNSSNGQFPLKRDYFRKSELMDTVSLFNAFILCTDEISDTVHGMQSGSTLMRQDVDINMHMLQDRLKKYAQL